MKASTDSTVKTKTEQQNSASGKSAAAKPVLNWKGWLETMNDLEQKHPRLAFWGRTAGFYLLMMVLFLYFMLANLSTAPKFVYTQF
ncbi:MAG: hypothetical protein PUF13_05265 [Lachnospiraceae bacterium]|nr:hypothetical protein [Lachnospiraceae bacterium]